MALGGDAGIEKAGGAGWCYVELLSLRKLAALVDATGLEKAGGTGWC